MGLRVRRAGEGDLLLMDENDQIRIRIGGSKVEATEVDGLELAASIASDLGGDRYVTGPGDPDNVVEPPSLFD